MSRSAVCLTPSHNSILTTMLPFNLGKYEIFKQQTYNWKKDISIENFLAVHIRYLKHSACWPIEYAKLLPAALSWLAAPLHWLYFTSAILISFHLLVLFVYSFFYNVIYAENATLADISNCLIESIIYAFTFFGTCYYQFRHAKCQEVVDIMKNHFKTRSAVGMCCLKFSVQSQFIIHFRTYIRHH